MKNVPTMIIMACLCFLAFTLQGELFIIDEESKIYYLPCGDLCGDYDDSDDDTTTLGYTYLGCYADSVDRVLTGDSTSDSQDMTTEVRHDGG